LELSLPSGANALGRSDGKIDLHGVSFLLLAYRRKQ